MDVFCCEGDKLWYADVAATCTSTAGQQYGPVIQKTVFWHFCPHKTDFEEHYILFFSQDDGKTQLRELNIICIPQQYLHITVYLPLQLCSEYQEQR